MILLRSMIPLLTSVSCLRSLESKIVSLAGRILWPVHLLMMRVILLTLLDNILR